MNILEGKNPGFELSTDRIQALADGIFAFAMTLLVVNLSFPDEVDQTNVANLSNLLYSQMHRFFNYALSFLLLSIFWIVHHQQFHVIKRSDQRLLWINIFILMFVALMPFSTDLVGDFSQTIEAKVFFAGNMLILGSLFLVNWAYATGNHRLVNPDMEKDAIARGIRRNLISPAVSLLVIAISFFIPHYSLYFYLLIPVIQALPWFRRVG